MLNRIREQVGHAGLLVAIVSLIAALGGGAYAASGPVSGSGKKRQHGKAAAGLNAKQKKEVTKIAKGFQGAGPAGAQGPAGADGQAGTKGDGGAQGEQGAQGIEGPQGDPGADGTFSTEPLPGGQTLTGGWVETAPSAGAGLAAQISFSIPLSADLTQTGCITAPQPQSCQVHFINPAGEEVAAEGVSSHVFATPEHCHGAAAAPAADAGNLCVYAGATENVLTNPIAYGLIKPAGGTFEHGAYVLFSASGSAALVQGTWAVTAP